MNVYGHVVAFVLSPPLPLVPAAPCGLSAPPPLTDSTSPPRAPPPTGSSSTLTPGSLDPVLSAVQAVLDVVAGQRSGTLSGGTARPLMTDAPPETDAGMQTESDTWGSAVGNWDCDQTHSSLPVVPLTPPDSPALGVPVAEVPHFRFLSMKDVALAAANEDNPGVLPC